MSRPPSPSDARFDDGAGRPAPRAAPPAAPGRPAEPAPPPPAPPPPASGDGAPVAPPAAPPPPAYADGLPPDLAELRELLLGPQQATVLDRLAAAGPEHLSAAELSDLLPSAVRLRAGRDDALGTALAPTIETGLKASVERNPQPVVDAIFPVIGPAIRRAVRHAVAGSVQSVNQALNYGLSWRGLRWRAEAWRTGSSFGEVVLRHTLAYRVEQVLLVHRESGLLLHHVEASGAEAADADLVSGMLTAIRQFVQDSFGVGREDALDALRVGDLSVWVEPGPRAVLAAVVRGTPPAELRETMRRTIEAVHGRYGASLGSFTGNTAPFDGVEALLEDVVDERYLDEAPAGLSPKAWLLLAALVAGLAWWGWTAWQTNAREAAYTRALHAAPGVEVIRAEHRDGRFEVLALRDPDATLPAPPDGVEAGDIAMRLVPFTSDDAEIVAARVARLAGHPDGVAFRADGGRVTALGLLPADADTAWAAPVRAALPATPGAASLDLSGLVPLDALAEAVEGRTVSFGAGEAPATDRDALVAELRALAEGAARADRPLRLRIVGHTDATGNDSLNDLLGRTRAQAVRDLLADDVPSGLTVETVSRGARERLADGVHVPSRRVTFEVLRGE